MSKGAILAARLCALMLVLLLSACSTAPSGVFGTGRAAKPTIRLGSTNFAEQVLLAELYAQMLEANSYRVERQLNLGSRETVEPALEAGQIDLYPEYLATLLTFVTKGANRGSTNPTETYQQLENVLRPIGIAVLEYAPAVNTNGFVVTRETAQRYQLARLSDLAPVGSRLVLGGPPECPIRPFCLAGLRQTYGITFRDFRVLDVGGPQTVAALEQGQVDVGLLFTTDPLIAARRFVLLEDDRNLQLADNIVPVIRSDLLNRAPDELPELLNSVSRKLTTEELTRLNTQVSLERGDPQQATRAWLRAQGLIK
jgi:osmoprotectant transport system substrate-binding protein